MPILGRSRRAVVLTALSLPLACGGSDPPAPLQPASAGMTQGGASAAAGSGPALAGSGGVTSAEAGTSAVPSGGGGASQQPPHLPSDADDYPKLLSQTGLYTDTATGTLAPGVLAFVPQFPLWSDASTKERWLYLPPDSKIDTTDMDNWVYPAGTKFWKQFTSQRGPNETVLVPPTRVETRLLWKFGNGRFDWLSVAYVWNAAGTDAEAAPDGLANALGTLHDVPKKDACDSCHTNTRERQLGPSAVQLNHSGAGLTLDKLVADGRLTAPPATGPIVPGDDATRSALGYLHANCGHCHRQGSVAGERYDLRTWLTVGSLASPADTDTYEMYVNQPTTVPDSEAEYRIKGGDPDHSEVIRRMSLRADSAQMPPAGTELVDDAGLATLRAWINALPMP